jgi:flagellar motor switch protein FliN
MQEMTDSLVTEPGTAPEVAPDARFSVPVTIELDATTVPLAQLQGLREGSVVPLDGAANGLPVRLLASGKPFARGTLVSVGDGYGVLIEEN